MKKTSVLFKQHVGRMIKTQWYVKGNVKVIPTTTEEILTSRGYEVIDVKEFLKAFEKKEEPPREKIIGLYDFELPRDSKHPDYKHEPCCIYKNDNVLLEGLEQAKVLTNTVEICNGLPESLIESESKLSLPDEVHLETEKKIKLCCMFDAAQDLLPKRKDPSRPTWVFPREYGITTARKSYLLGENLTLVCEQFAKNIKNKACILDAFFSTPIHTQGKKVQFEMTNDLVWTTGKKLKIMAEPSSTHDIALSEMGPVDDTIGINKNHFYEMQDIYSPGSNSKWPYVQTAFILYDPTTVRNIIEEEITESQILGRSLINGFSIAVAQARAIFGSDIEKLPEPVVVPVVQTDGKLYHFSIFQLNTLHLKNPEVKNIFWNSERIPLYTTCEYQEGRPVLDGYNPDVIRKLISFYDIE